MNRFGDIDCSFKRLPPVFGFRSAKVLSLEEALQPIEPQIEELAYYIRIAKRHCHFPNDHNLSKDQSASIYIYTMEWGETSLYRVLNQALRSENRQALKIWFPYLKLFDTALDLLPTVKESVWRGVPLDIGKNFTKNQMFTWWSISSCSSSVNVIEQFLQSKNNSTLFLIEVINGKKVSGYTEYEGEDEVILRIGTEFRVKADHLKRADGSHIVHLIEIQDDDDLPLPSPITINVNTDESVLQMKNLMKEMEQLKESTTPRYFFILPAKDYDFKIIDDHQNLFNLHFKLYFLCECSNDPTGLHIVASSDGYSIRRLKEFLMRFGRYLQITLNLVNVLISLDELIISQPVGISNSLNNIKQKINFAKKFLNKPEIRLVSGNSSLTQNNVSRSPLIKDIDLEELPNYLERHDSTQFLGNLYRIIAHDGNIRWIYQQHYEIISDKTSNDFIKTIKTIGAEFNQENKELILNKLKLTSANVKLISGILTKGFIVSKMVFNNCSMYEGDFEKLVDIIFNRSSVYSLEVHQLDILNYFGYSKYIYGHQLKISFFNNLFNITSTDYNQSANVLLIEKIFSQNKIHRILEISAADFLEYEQQLQQSLDTNTMITELIVNHANNIEILNSIFQIKINKLERLKLNSSLGLPTVANHFCQLLKSNQTLIELNLIDSTVLSNADFLENLFQILKQHKSIKQLHLHISLIENSDKKENLLINYLQNNRSLSHLRLSKSKISSQLIRQFVDSIEKHHSLIHLEFYRCQFNENDIQQLEKLENQGNLFYLLISQESYLFNKRSKYGEDVFLFFSNKLT